MSNFIIIACSISTVLSIIALIAAVIALGLTLGMRWSTHKVELVPADPLANNPLRNKFFERQEEEHREELENSETPEEDSQNTQNLNGFDRLQSEYERIFAITPTNPD